MRMMTKKLWKTVWKPGLNEIKGNPKTGKLFIAPLC